MAKAAGNVSHRGLTSAKQLLWCANKRGITSDLRPRWQTQLHPLCAEPSAMLGFSGRASRDQKQHRGNPWGTSEGTRRLPQMGTERAQPQGCTVWGLSDAPPFAHHHSQTQTLPPEQTVQNPPTLQSPSSFLAQHLEAERGYRSGNGWKCPRSNPFAPYHFRLSPHGHQHTQWTRGEA